MSSASTTITTPTPTGATAAAMDAGAANARMPSPARYAFGLRVLHWAMAVTVLGGIGAVMAAIRQPDTPEGKRKRKEWMRIHTTMGVTTFALLPFRTAWRMVTPVPKLPDSPTWMKVAAGMTHHALYAFVGTMALTGVTMAYVSGTAVPFLWMEIPSSSMSSTPNAASGHWWFSIHKTVGKYGKYLVPLHIGGVVAHLSMGQRVLAKMNPFVH